MSMWPLAISVAGAAVLAGTVAVPSVRRRVFGDVKQDWLCHELEFDSIGAEGFTVRCKNKTQCRVYQLDGQAYDTKPEAEQLALYERRASFLHEMAKLNVILRFFGTKRHKAIHHPATWLSPALQEIGDAEAKLFRKSYDVRWFIMVQSPDTSAMERADEKLRSLFASYNPKRLYCPNSKGQKYPSARHGGITTKETEPKLDCPLTGFLNFLTCGDLRDDLKAVSENISANLPASDLLFDDTGLLTTHQPTPTYYRAISVREWPDLVSGHILHELMALKVEIEVSQVLVPQNKEASQLLLKRQATAQWTTPRKVEEALTVVDILSEGSSALYTTQFSIFVRSDDLSKLNEAVDDVCRVLDEQRIVYSVETKGMPVAWYNRMPGREKLLRPLKLLAEAPAALWPFEMSPTGLDKTYYTDAPVRSFRVSSGQSFSLQFQPTDAKLALGHYLVFAPSNGGKSTFLMHLLGGLTKFKAVPSYILDSNEGTRFMVEVMGGLYQSYDKLELNPLDAEDNAINRQRLKLLMQLMMASHGDDEMTEETLQLAISTAFDLPIENRSFNSIFPLSFPRHSPIRRAFAPWVTTPDGQEGSYARIFNAARDSLSGLLESQYMVGINMNEALEDPVLGPPVVAHIANAIERMARSGRTKAFNIFIDEAANLLRNPAFRDLATVMYREYRKFGGSVGMAFQDPEALYESGISSAVIQNTASYFFFPNPSSKPETYEPFNLNDEQKSFIFSAPEGRNVLFIQRDSSTNFERSAILNIDLAPYGDALRFYRSGPEAVADLKTIQKKWGEAWLAHV